MNTSSQPAPIADEGLRCLTCDYNLTGLTSDRCPECGTVVDWPAVREARDSADLPRGTCWERWPWYLKPAAFVVTACQAAFMPWVVARQLKDRPSPVASLTFLVICMLACIGVGTLTVWSGGDHGAAGAWMTGVVCQVILQTLLFGLVLSLRRIRFPVRFWLAVTAYFSYPLLVELWVGIPMIGPHSTVWPFPAGQLGHQLGPTILFYWWWVGLAVIAFVRVPRRIWWRTVLVILAVPLLACGSTIVGCELGGRIFG